MEKEPTIQDVLDAVHKFAGDTQERFEKVDDRFDSLEKNLRLEIGKARDAALTHADIKSTDAIVESGMKINKHEDRDKKFKHELVSAMTRNSLLGVKELKQLEQAI